jgi:AcrR family transcriptional regulator
MSEPSLAARAAQRAVDARVRTSEQDVRRLLDVGLSLMAEGGTDEPPRLVDIIRAAGLSNQAFYRYFAGKDDLVAAIVDDGERRLVSYVRHQLETAALDDVLAVFVRAVMSQAAEPEIAAATRAVLWNAGRSLDTTGARSRQLHELLAELLSGPLERLGSPDSSRDAAVITTAVTSFMLDSLWRQVPPTDADVAHLLAFCRAGLQRS